MKKIGLIGLGCVGLGFYQLLKEKKYSKAIITKVVVKNRKKKRDIEKENLFFDVDAVINDSSIDIIVEVIDDAEAAFEIVKKALAAGKPIVTANKKMIAENLPELIALQQKYATPVLYEAAVCGAIPIIRKIEQQFSHERIDRIRGIFNGTSNYILTKLNTGNQDYSQALDDAQRKGFAESDPTNDVGGHDAVFKSVILARHAFGVSFDPRNVFVVGIDALARDDFGYAKSIGQKLKLIPTIFSFGNKVGIVVLPQFVKSDDQLFLVENEFNAVIVDGQYAGKQSYYGLGAGAFPTAFSLFSDLRDVLGGLCYDYTRLGRSYQALNDDEILLEVYVRFKNKNVKELVGIKNVREGFIHDDFHYVIGETTLAKLKRASRHVLEDGGVIISTGSIRYKGHHLNEDVVLANKHAAALNAISII